MIHKRLATGHEIDDAGYPAYEYKFCTADTLVKSTGGILHTITITCNDVAPTAGLVIIYDNSAESGDVIFNHTFTTTPFVPLTVTLDCIFYRGCYVGFTTTNDINVTVTYR